MVLKQFDKAIAEARLVEEDLSKERRAEMLVVPQPNDVRRLGLALAVRSNRAFKERCCGAGYPREPFAIGQVQNGVAHAHFPHETINVTVPLAGSWGPKGASHRHVTFTRAECYLDPDPGWPRGELKGRR